MSKPTKVVIIDSLYLINPPRELVGPSLRDYVSRYAQKVYVALTEEFQDDNVQIIYGTGLDEDSVKLFRTTTIFSDGADVTQDYPEYKDRIINILGNFGGDL